jgi:Xaa-Pro aminopeptidase
MKPAFFINNRRKLRERVGPGLIIVTANGLLQRSGDSTFPFRQDSNFWYLTGLDEPDLTLVMDDGRDYIILPPREEIRNIFDGYIDSAQLKKVSGVDSVLTEAQGWPPLNQKLKTVQEVGIQEPLQRFVRGYDFYSNPARRHLKERLRRTNSKLATKDIREDLAYLRMIKDPQEIAEIQAAIDITIASLKVVKRKLPKLQYQHEVVALLTYEYLQRGASGHAFDPVAASGKNAVTVHHYGKGKIQKNQLFLIDTGAEVNNYAADISRTIPVGRPTKRQQAILEAALRCQQYAISLIKPGVNFYEYEKTVAKYVGTELKQLGLIKSASMKSIRKYFPYATSHYVGLDTHDVGDRYIEFQENMVLAVEPGLAIAEEGIAARIEDVVVVTKDGCRNMSSSLPALL